MKILYATRAFESMPNEGGFITLRDLSTAIGQSGSVDAGFFSVRNNSGSVPRRIGIYQSTGWSQVNAIRFLYGLYRYQMDFDLVHLAHMPTPNNSRVMNWITGKGRRKGVRYVQTVTALPAPPEKLDLPSLLWGDCIVCLNPDIHKELLNYHPNVKCITAIPSPERLANDSMLPVSVELPDQFRYVIFPFHFMHLPDGFELQEITQGLLEKYQDICIIMTYRLTESEKAHALHAKLPEELRSRFIIVNAQHNVLSYIRKAGLLIYPMAEAPRKFNPPLIVLEAIALGCPVLVSGTVYIPDSFSNESLISMETLDHISWLEAADRLLNLENKKSMLLDQVYNSYVGEFINLYRNL